MNQFIKTRLKAIRIYYPLQSLYRGILFSLRLKIYRRLYRKYKGTGFTCNACGATYRKFIPDYPASENKMALENNRVVAGYGENIYCPQCMSGARDRLVIAVINDEVLLAGKSILHLSPEKAVYAFLNRKANVISADLEPGFYKAIDKQVQKQDATKFSYNDGQFDVVIANHILEHICADAVAMQEIFRVMKPGARAFLQVPYSEIIPATIEDPEINNPARQSALYGQKDHVRIYSLNDYVRRLQQAGFKVDVLGENELKPFFKHAIQPNEKFFKIFKPA